MSESLKLGFKVGEYVEWVVSDDQTSGLKPGLVGRVIKASDNTMAAQVSALSGIELSSAWVLAEFENSARVVVRKATEVRRIRLQSCLPNSKSGPQGVPRKSPGSSDLLR